MKCEDCKYYKGEAENCCDDLTVGIAGIEIKKCDGYEEKEK